MNTHKNLTEKYKQLKENYIAAVISTDSDQQKRFECLEDLDAFVFWLISRAHE